ncbi:MAG: transposase, partial [Pseudomonadota bacterium]
RKGGALRLAYCWAHARRKLHEIAKGRTAPFAEEDLRQIREIYRIESEIRGLSAVERRSIRRARSSPLVDAFGDWVEEQRARVSAKSPIGEAMRYIFKLWDGLNVFLEDGRVEMDSNAVERAIRPIANGWSLCTPSLSVWKH